MSTTSTAAPQNNPIETGQIISPEQVSAALADIEKNLAVFAANAATLSPLLSTLKTSLESAQIAAKGHLNLLANAEQAKATALKTEASA